MICLRENVWYFDPITLGLKVAVGEFCHQIENLLSENKIVVLICLYSFLDSQITNLRQFITCTNATDIRSRKRGYAKI